MQRGVARARRRAHLPYRGFPRNSWLWSSASSRRCRRGSVVIGRRRRAARPRPPPHPLRSRKPAANTRLPRKRTRPLPSRRNLSIRASCPAATGNRRLSSPRPRNSGTSTSPSPATSRQPFPCSARSFRSRATTSQFSPHLCKPSIVVGCVDPPRVHWRIGTRPRRAAPPSFRNVGQRLLLAVPQPTFNPLEFIYVQSKSHRDRDRGRRRRRRGHGRNRLPEGHRGVRQHLLRPGGVLLPRLAVLRRGLVLRAGRSALRPLARCAARMARRPVATSSDCFAVNAACCSEKAKETPRKSCCSK